MASRSRSTLETGGTTHLPITPSTIKKIISTIKKVPLGMRKLLWPPSSAAKRTTFGSAMPAWLLNRGGEHEQRHKRQVDEVCRLNQTDRDEERGEESALRLRLPGDAGDQRVTRDAVTDTGADCTAGHDQSTADERAGSDSGIHSLSSLITGRPSYQDLWQVRGH